MAIRKRGRRAAERCLPQLLFSLLGWVLLGLIRRAAAPSPGLWFLLEGLGTSAFVALPAWAGLSLPGSGGMAALPLCRASAGQLFAAVICGALFAAPASLLREMAAVYTGSGGAVPQPVDGSFVFLLTGCVLAVPLCHAVFYRGYLERSLRGLPRGGRLIPALLFALSGACPADFLSRLCLGLVLSEITVRHGTLLSSAAAHASFLCAWLFTGMLGLQGFFTGTGFFAVSLRVLLALAWYYSFKKVCGQKASGETIDAAGLLRLTKRDRLILAAAALLTLASGVWGVLQ